MLPASTDQIRFLCLFRDVAEDHFAELAAGAVAKRVPPYESLIAEGDRPANLHVVLEGAVQLYSRRGRREASIGVVQPPVTFFRARPRPGPSSRR
jgi:CRP-like cAMP-binding protein